MLYVKQGKLEIPNGAKIDKSLKGITILAVNQLP